MLDELDAFMTAEEIVSSHQLFLTYVLLEFQDKENVRNRGKLGSDVEEQAY